MTRSELERSKNWYRWRMLPKLTMLIWIAVVVLWVILWHSLGLAFRRIEFPLALLGACGGAMFQISAAYHTRVSHFLECFSRCNEAYARLNGRLKQLPGSNGIDTNETASKGTHDAIIDYFNLCAEEYLMHKTGVLPDFVWDVWRGGIHDCACMGHIKAAWDTEMKANNLYYGFDLGQIMEKHHEAHGHQCKKRDNCPQGR